MTYHAPYLGTLEIRQDGGASVLRGSMKYGQTATISNAGKTRKERISGNAFSWQLAKFQELQNELSAVMQGAFDRYQVEALQEQLMRRNTNILVGHDWDKPLGDRLSGTARVRSTDEALDFEVDLPDPSDWPTYMADVVKQVRGGRSGGVSPGFYIPPKDVSPRAVTFQPEPGNPGVQIRVVNDAILPEISIVTRPVYPSNIDIRAEDFEWPDGLDGPKIGREIYAWL